MPFQLVLTLDYFTDTHWRWLLHDAAGRFLADHEVTLDSSDAMYEGFEDLSGYLNYYESVRPAEEVLGELGTWIGTTVLGAVGKRFLDYEQTPACVVQVRVPPAAQNLLFRPFEFAHLDGKSLAERGFRLVYTVAHDLKHKVGSAVPKDVSAVEALRILGVFSLPRDATPLNLRHERHRIQQLVRNFVQTRGLAVDLRLLQYGATRQLLTDVLQEAPGWDVIHFSGHGSEGELILEKPDGTADRIAAEKLAELLRPARSRLKLLTLSACYSGAADLRGARAQIGLPDVSTGQTAVTETATVLPSLGQRLAEELDCAVLAMRFPVLDNFATELTLTLYNRMLEKKQPLPQALQLALTDALSPKNEPYLPDFSRSTPLLFGARAADLRLQAPLRLTSFELPQTGLFHFPPSPDRFVGRLMPMLDASQALAPESGKTGVLFYGMAGAGKTACALELAYSYDRQNLERFTAFVWHKAPEENHDIADSLTQLALSMEKQLPGLELVGLIDDPQDFKEVALPRLRGLLQKYSILLVLDNLEGLLTAHGDWRDSRWGDLIKVLLDHNGLSRLILTSRRLPISFVNHQRLQANSIHALSFQESVILARELPHLKELFKNEEGREKLQRILSAAQGHPKLLELADAIAANPAALEEDLPLTETASDQRDVARSAFFVSGRSDQSEDVFVQDLRNWTVSVAQGLSPTAQLLAQFLARIEDADRTQTVVQANWEDFLKCLIGERGEKEPVPEPACAQAQTAMGEPGLGLQQALNQLARAALIEIETITSNELTITAEVLETLIPILGQQNTDVAALLANSEGASLEDLSPHIQAAFDNPTEAVQNGLNNQAIANTTLQFHIHPGVAEALLFSTLPPVLAAVDIEVGNYFRAVSNHGMKTEMQGGGRFVVEGGRRAVPYLLRAQLWVEASTLLETVISRDDSPATLGFAIPQLRYIAEKAQGKVEALIIIGLLARALIAAHRYSEAEVALRNIIDSSVTQENYRSASIASGDLFNLLFLTGRFEEALRLAKKKADYTTRANLGPWSRLGDEGRRLQALNALGHYGETLEAVQMLRPHIEHLQEQPTADEIVELWSVREAMLDVGRSAASNLEKWEMALSLNAELVEYGRKRGADEVYIAGARFNDHGPLLEMGRIKEARDLLHYCRDVFEKSQVVRELAAVYNALAELESRAGHHEDSIRFEQTALRYAYQTGQPLQCANHHYNLAIYIVRAKGALESAMAHIVAASVICLQSSSGRLSTTISSLAKFELPPAPPSFAQVCTVVKQVEGVRFEQLFAQLPKAAPDGDTAIQVVWQMAKELTEVRAEKE